MEGIRAVQAGRDPQGVRRWADEIIDLESIVEDDLNKLVPAE